MSAPLDLRAVEGRLKSRYVYASNSTYALLDALDDAGMLLEHMRVLRAALRTSEVAMRGWLVLMDVKRGTDGKSGAETLFMAADNAAAVLAQAVDGEAAP